MHALSQMTQSHSASIPMSYTDWTKTTQLPKFDPSLGVLKSVKFSYLGQIETRFAFENGSGLVRQWTARLEGQISSKLTNYNLSLFEIPLSTSFSDTRGRFDGVIDFAGPSGIQTAPILMQNNRSVTYDLSNSSYSDLVNFVGNDELIFENISKARSYYNGPADGRFAVSTTAAAEQVVDYVYEKAQCARSPGYWKNHLKKVGIQQLTIAGQVYNQAH
jgi:hypothetical protein